MRFCNSRRAALNMAPEPARRSRKMNRISIKAVRDAPVLPETDSPKRASLLPEILDRLKDPNVAVSQIIHLIAIEIAGIADAMRKNEEATNPRSESKSPVEQV